METLVHRTVFHSKTGSKLFKTSKFKRVLTNFRKLAKRMKLLQDENLTSFLVFTVDLIIEKVW